MTGERLPAAGLLLAGGGSRRMGRDKLFLPWGDTTLLVRIASVLTRTMSETWVVGLPETTPPPGLVGLRYIGDGTPIGPLGGLLAGLEAMASPAGLVVAADMPFVGMEAIRRLWQYAAGAPATILRTTDGMHPLFGVYRRECLPAIRSAIGRGERRVSAFFEAVPPRIVDAGSDPFWARTLLNINSPADYALALRLREEKGHPYS